MKNVFNINQKIGEIATKFPKAIDIFMSYEIDFCCGGDRPLKEALKEQEMNEKEVIDKLNKYYSEFVNKNNEETDWTKSSMSNLIDYIVQKHHGFMRETLPITNELINKILRVHYVDNGEILSKVHKLFNNLKLELEEHLIKEEEVLFPLIKEYEKNPSKETKEKAIATMNETEDEHDKAGDILKEIRRVTNKYEVPETGCNSFKIAYEKMQEIESDLFKHIHLENNILFEKLKKI
ncbi:iron-sulfur cluster repair di-iron protein [Tepidibacter aestuarii]|uniref:iron-sulfur cluster repair di-iron protein n=1 Tax=Tepidibacter aestuarii TaxID=2925782 RepID=UPI0020C04C0C|nr:iron-sulfur cluster repair di-iron protein [Tepidibacter aestuarii]CAH2214690.1 regulator of cell morphogenesis and NO signaling [Tepidibacter aestuarii]